MEGKPYEELSEKEQKQVDEILAEGEMTDSEVVEDDAIIAQKIKNGEIMSIPLIEKFKLLSEKKLRKTEKEILVDFGKSISVEMISEDKIKICVGKEEIIVTDQQAKKIISNGFADQKFVNVTGVCKKETWEKKDKKGHIKKIIIAGLGVLIVAIPIIIQSCNGCIQKVGPDPIPDYTISETTPTYSPDPTIPIVDATDPDEYKDVNDIIKKLVNVYWVPNSQQQNDWSAKDDENTLGLSEHKSADDINKEMQENQKIIEDIMKFKSKYENKKLSPNEYDKGIEEAQDLVERVNKMLGNAHDTLELAKALNKKVIKAGVPHLGDLETESKARKAALSSLESLQGEFNELIQQLNQGGKTR